MSPNFPRGHGLQGTRGGPDSLANQPAVREVIRKVLRSPYGAMAGPLVGTASSNEGGWGQQILGRRGYATYEARVVGTLAELGILQPLACLTCPQCASTIRVTPAELGELVRCELCTALVPFGSYIANHPTHPAKWAMTITPALDEAHFNEMIPVMAALSVFETASGNGFLSGNGLLYLVGVELAKGAATCEVDFITLVADRELPAVIIGEAKGGQPDNPAQRDLLSSDDIEHLEAIQDAFRAVGIDCWICFTTTRPSLQQAELDLLRRSCERSLTPVFNLTDRLLPVLPVVLTGEDLSVPAMDGRHPARRVHGSFPRLQALAQDTCQRQLGLANVNFTVDSSGNWLARPQWRS